MPHILLSTSANLVENVDVNDILAALASELSRHETIDPAAVKAYHSLHKNWAMGAGATAGFAHCEVSILAGRPAELRKRIADGIYETMRRQFSASQSAGEVSLTVEVREMDRDTYRKLA